MNIKAYLTLALFSIALLVTSCADNSPVSSGNTLQPEVSQKIASYKSKKLDNEVVDGMSYVRGNSLSFNSSGNLQVFLTELFASNKKIPRPNTGIDSVEAIVTYGRKKEIKYFDYKEDDNTHFSIGEVTKKGRYMYEFKDVDGSKFKHEHFCILDIYKIHGKKVKLFESRKFDVSSLLEDNSDEFMISIIDVIDKNRIRVMYNSSYNTSYPDKDGIYNTYGGIAVLNIKTRDIKPEVKTDFFISSYDAEYIYGGNRKDWGDDDNYYIADKKTGKILCTIKNSINNNAKIGRFGNGARYCIKNDGSFISEGINTDKVKCIGTIKDDKYFKKYMIQNMAVKNDSEFYLLYSIDWTNKDVEVFDGISSNFFVVKYTL